jgi:hypothetical protein
MVSASSNRLMFSLSQKLHSGHTVEEFMDLLVAVGGGCRSFLVSVTSQNNRNKII